MVRSCSLGIPDTSIYITFAKLWDVIMGWKHIDTLHIRPPLTKKCTVNVVKVSFNKEEFEYNMDTEGGRIKSGVETVRKRTGYDVETKEREKVMHKSYTDIVWG